MSTHSALAYDRGMTVDECRTMLGDLAKGKTDVQILRWHDRLSIVANQMYDHLQTKVRVSPEAIIDAAFDVPGLPTSTEDQLKRDALERIRWTAHTFENGLEADDKEGK